jgi:hypothetical protein
VRPQSAAGVRVLGTTIVLGLSLAVSPLGALAQDPAPAPAPAPEPAPAPPQPAPPEVAAPPAASAEAAPPAAESAQAPPPPAAVQTRAASANPLVLRPLWARQIAARIKLLGTRYGQVVDVVGRLPSAQHGVPILLQFRPRGGAWRPIATGKSGPGGGFRLSAPARWSGAFRVVTVATRPSRDSGTASAPHTLTVNPVLRAGGVRRSARWRRPGLVGGRLLGAGAGKSVVLQRRIRGVWHTIARTDTRAGGRFHLRFAPFRQRGALLRVLFPGDHVLEATDDLVGRLKSGLLGTVRLAPGANRPGASLSPLLMRYAVLMAGVVGRPLVIDTGTNHSLYSVSGNVSDHAFGNAADFTTRSNGDCDRVAAAALIVAGVPPARAFALARRGGAFVLHRGGLRIQILWKVGGMYGNHFDHVHVGLR